MPERDTQDFRPRARSSGPSASGIAAAVLVAAALGGAAWWYWWRPADVPEPPPEVAEAPAQPAEPEPVPAPELTEPQNPVDALEQPAPGLPALQDSDAHVTQALNGLLGRDKVGSFLQVDGFVRRAVATVDNLTRSQAPASLWPVHPAPQRFTVEGAGDSGGSGDVQTIAPANAARYKAFVAFAEAIPTDAAVKLYARLYPLFQTAYEDLGYPSRYFNDRLIAVIDHLRAAPEPAGPVQVRLTKVEGEVPSVQPWVRYEYADPELQALSSGQKMLVRVGLDNERRLKAVLGELRRRIATGEMAKPAG